MLNGEFGIAQGGIGFSTWLGRSNSKLYCPTVASPGSNFIAVVQYETLVDDNDGIFLAGKTSWSSANGFMFESKTDVNTLELNGGNGSTFPTVTVPAVGKADGKVHTLVVRYRGTNADVYFDGKYYGTVNIVAAAGAWLSGIGIANYASTIEGNAHSRRFYLAAVVLDGDPLSLSANPWQIIARSDRRTIIDLGGSGLSSVYADSALAYYIRSLLSSDNGIQYAIRNAIYRDDAVGYALRAAISANSAVGYVLRQAIAKDDLESYLIRGIAQSDDAEAYKIRGLVQTSDNETYSIRSSVQASVSTAYDVMSSATVAANNAVSYAVRGMASSDAVTGYTLRSAVAASESSAYSVRSAVSRDAVAGYEIAAAESSVYADSTVAYSVDGVAPSCPSAESIAAAVLAALQATTIPVNIEAVNSIPIKGAGTPSNPWNPA